MKKNIVIMLCGLFLLFALTIPVSAATSINTLFSTGVNDNAQALASGVDPHYQIVFAAQGLYNPYQSLLTIVPLAPYYNVAIPRNPKVSLYPPTWAWLPEYTPSNWIGPSSAFVTGCQGDSAGVDDYGYYIDQGIWIYQTTFDLTGLKPETVQIKGLWGIDDWGWMYLNLQNPLSLEQNRLVASGGGYDSLDAFEISGTNGLFLSGQNTLTIIVWDAWNCVTGLQIYIQSATADLK